MFCFFCLNSLVLINCHSRQFQNLFHLGVCRWKGFFFFQGKFHDLPSMRVKHFHDFKVANIGKTWYRKFGEKDVFVVKCPHVLFFLGWDWHTPLCMPLFSVGFWSLCGWLISPSNRFFKDSYFEVSSWCLFGVVTQSFLQFQDLTMMNGRRL